MSSRTTRRASAVRVLALPAVVAVGLLAWQFPRGEEGLPAPDPVNATGPPGASSMGATDYKIPKGAVVVSPSGDDAAPGTADEPLRTLRKAIAKARDGATIVLRAGTYHESVTVPEGKRLTVQAHPGEAVWFDGSEPVTGWRAEGGAWVKEGWTASFDASPSYTAGAAASDDPDFQFVDPAHPMAAHPDQVWIDGTAQRQVGSRGQVKRGTFYVDKGARRLYLGSDPGGREVRASTLAEAITVRGDRSVLRGIGVRRYATSLPQLGSVKIVGADVTVENVAVTDSATTGLSVLGPHARVRRFTATRNGMLGIHANHADDLRIELVRATRNNLERFKPAPVSGGIKITRSRTVTVTTSLLADNLGKGLWLDESVYDSTVTGNRIVRNLGHGIVLELGAKAVIAGNLVRDGGGDAIKINNSSGVEIWNNTLTGNGRTIHLVQDPRSPDDPRTPGRDPRRPYPDPTMTWRLGQITVANNTLAHARDDAPCLLCVEDHTRRRAASAMEITVNGDIYVRPDSGSPRRLVVWARGKGDPYAFPDLDDFRSATRQEARGTAYDDPEAAGPDGALGASVAAAAHAAALPLPERVAELLDRPAGTRYMGAWDLRAD
ncbi:right-handed parallel beta-helix repeat-containing protein [Actinomadura viridis]|uniref:right-handed parallel beta-helix repeat-containing protein n=1 Tax=Actinomadura viridis TaxID=58110 RepID=UPI0036A60AF5